MYIVAENSERSAPVETHRWRPTIRYLSQTEVHVYALSIGASVLLSFFPFLIVVLTLIRDVLHFPLAEKALVLALRDYFPDDLGAFIIRNLTKVNHGRYQLTSVLLLLFTANGIFEPLEVALNRAWGVKKNRSYIANQVLSLFLIILCGGLALGSVLLTAVNTQFLTAQFGLREAWAPLLIFKLAAIPVTILSLLLIYWVLPNRRVPVRRVLPVAILVGIALEIWKYIFLFAWPWLDRKFQNEYGPFNYAASIVIFSMLTSLLVLAGAEWSARKPIAELQACVPTAL
ncbi:MAG: YihY/virulence factor BrkB family protein [Acidobacteriota bacterium]|nr:YihY/virulence factor BrkB family protein [Acidobacteriota bacterium]